MSRTFPVLHVKQYLGMAHKTSPDFPKSIPWELIEPHLRQAMDNHGGQTLERIAERGGLSPIEIYCVLQDKTWYDIQYGDFFEVNRQAEAYILALLKNQPR